MAMRINARDGTITVGIARDIGTAILDMGTAARATARAAIAGHVASNSVIIVCVCGFDLGRAVTNKVVEWWK